MHKINQLVYASLFLALALALPFLTGQIPQIGAMLTPMHFPVLLCGFLCGWQWGIAVGFAAPLLRSVLFGMPVMYPMAICMALVLATYAAVAGMLYRVFPQKRRFLYVSLIISMILGRLVWGLARFLCVGLDISTFGLSAFWDWCSCNVCSRNPAAASDCACVGDCFRKIHFRKTVMQFVYITQDTFLF